MSISVVPSSPHGLKSAVRPMILMSTDDTQDCLRYFYSLVTGAHELESFTDGIAKMLAVGAKRLECDTALLVRRISETVFEVQAQSEPAQERFHMSQHLTLSPAVPDEAQRGETVLLTGRSGEALELGGVVLEGAVVVPVHGQDLERYILVLRDAPFTMSGLSDDDSEILDYMARGVVSLLDQQRYQSQRKNRDAALQMHGSIHTLEDYMVQAKIPELYGIPGRVVDILVRRIGDNSLSIGDVADDLNLSKRTLQRRLQQQSVNFAELRDQVRYHYAIDYLIKNRKSIDNISLALDFSDRTSFTNAFKRWTGLSPSTFRKLFRDLV